MRRRQLVGALLVATSALGYASGPLLAKSVYATGTDWLALLAWRFTLAGVLTWGWLLAVPAGRLALSRMTHRQAAVLIGLGMVFAGSSTTYYAAVQLAPVSLVALLLYVYPALVAVGAMRLGQPFEGRRAWVALGIAIVGAICTLDGIETGASPAGVALAVASPLIYAGYILLAGRAAGERRPGTPDPEPGTGTADVPPLLAAALMMLGTWLVLVVLAIAGGERVLPGQIPPAAWPGIAGIAIFATVIALQAFYAGVARLGAARTALVSTLEPVFTVSLAVLLLGERLAPVQVLGGGLVVAAVMLAQTSRAAPVEPVVEREA